METGGEVAVHSGTTIGGRLKPKKESRHHSIKTQERRERSEWLNGRESYLTQLVFVSGEIGGELLDAHFFFPLHRCVLSELEIVRSIDRSIWKNIYIYSLLPNESTRRTTENMQRKTNRRTR